ncbi:MAG: hypothetical protein ACE5H3_11650 [Planctomycetota bacterium]
MKPGNLLLILASGGLLLWAAGEACGPGECPAVPPAPAGPAGPAAPASSITTAVFQVGGLMKTASGAT